MIARSTDREALGLAAAWAAANWLLDVVVVLAATVGKGTRLTAVLLAYVIAHLVAAVPLTPGGVGIVEAAMVAALVASGAPQRRQPGPSSGGDSSASGCPTPWA